MLEPPSLDALCAEVSLILAQTCQRPIESNDRPLIGDLGLDSLDMIESAFSLEDRFGFQFAERHPLEVLNDRLGGDRIIQNGELTGLGRQMAVSRMPELAGHDLGERITADGLQQFYSVVTYARMIREFYLALPDRDPSSGETVVLDDWKPVTKESRVEVKPPTGNQLMDDWAERTAAELS